MSLAPFFLKRGSFAPPTLIAISVLLFALAPDSAAGPADEILLSWNNNAEGVSGSAAGGAKIEMRGRNREARKGMPLDLSGSSMVIRGVSEGICRAVAQTREFSCLVTLSCAKPEQQGPARIVSFSSDQNKRNFTIGQHGKHFDLRVRTAGGDENGMQRDSAFGIVAADKPRHVLFSVRERTASCYVDGKLVKKIALSGPLGDWSPKHAIVFGDELDGHRDWSGKLHRVVLFSRALDPAAANALLEARSAEACLKGQVAGVHKELVGVREQVAGLKAELIKMRQDRAALAEQLAAAEPLRKEQQARPVDRVREDFTALTKLAEHLSDSLDAARRDSEARLAEQRLLLQRDTERYRDHAEKARGEAEALRLKLELRVSQLEKELAAAQPPPPPAPEPENAKLLPLSILRFDTNAAYNRRDRAELVNEVRAILAAKPDTRFLIVGHTCNSGRAGANLALSLRRAEGVRDSLIASGIRPNTLEVRGVGESQPVSDNTSYEGRRLNRRVEIFRR